MPQKETGGLGNVHAGVAPTRLLAVRRMSCETRYLCARELECGDSALGKPPSRQHGHPNPTENHWRGMIRKARLYQCLTKIANHINKRQHTCPDSSGSRDSVIGLPQKSRPKSRQFSVSVCHILQVLRALQDTQDKLPRPAAVGGAWRRLFRSVPECSARPNRGEPGDATAMLSHSASRVLGSAPTRICPLFSTATKKMAKNQMRKATLVR